MYTVMMAARIKIGSFESEFKNAAAVPWDVAWVLGGLSLSSFALLIAFTASPKEALGARLNDRVTTGNWPWWFTTSDVAPGSKCVKALNGTCCPFEEWT